MLGKQRKGRKRRGFQNEMERGRTFQDEMKREIGWGGARRGP
jgi:hypothetical protein